MTVLPFVLFLGCVGRNHHELVEMQLDATRTALSAQQSTAREEMAALQARITALEDEIHARQAQLDLVSARHIAHDAELEALRARYAELLFETTHPPPPPEPPPAPPKPKRPPPKVPAPLPVPPPEPPRPALDASVTAMKEALFQAEEARFMEQRSVERHSVVLTGFAALVDEGFVEVRREGPSSVVTILAAKLYQEGTVQLSPRGEDIAQRIASALTATHGWNVEIQGHTDATPFHSPELASNWELGFGRGVTLLRALREYGVDEPAHVTSYADTRPAVIGGTPDADRLNARVEIWLSEIPGIEGMFSPTPPAPEPPPPSGEQPTP